MRFCKPFFTRCLRFALAAVFTAGFLFPTMTAAAQSQISLIIHYIEGQAIVGRPAYTTQVYFSVIDDKGDPIPNLDVSNLTLTEDSQKVEIKSLKKADNVSLHLVLALDTSGSMMGSSMSGARSAAANFVSHLKADDEVAIYTFNNHSDKIIDFTADKSSISKKIDAINAVSGAGTCLYDTAVQAVQTAATLPTGQRAVILLTDGVDETSQGVTCSMHSIDDVIKLASEGNTRVPIYTIGLGSRTDVKGLQRMAVNSGGQYLYAPDAKNLGSLFDKLSNQLSSQFVLEYESTGAPGAHTVIVTANVAGGSGQDSRNFMLPALPITLTITNPNEGGEVKPPVHITVKIEGQGDPVEAVVFKSGGVELGRDTTSPYELDWTPGADAGHDQVIEVVALGAGNKELASDQRHFSLDNEPEALPPAAAAPAVIVVTPVPVPGSAGEFSTVNLVSYVVLGVVLILAVVVLVVVLRRKPAIVPSGGGPAFGAGGQEVLAKLVVQESDDAAKPAGTSFDITKMVTNLGRGAGNDLAFPADTPVSRSHATLEQRGSKFYLYEIISTGADGSAKRPTYGTFINGKRVGMDPLMVNSGDILQLGNRLKLLFEEVVKPTASMAEMTMDGFGAEATMDGFSTMDGTMDQPETENQTVMDTDQTQMPDDPYGQTFSDEPSSDATIME